MLIGLLLALAAGLVLGGAGMRRLGRASARLAGPWRPAAGGLAFVAALASVALLTRGALAASAALAALAVVLAGAARLRRPTAAPPRASPEGTMSQAEARATLGVGDGASEAEVEAAFRRLMRRVHPDLGGASGLAARLNLARETLRPERPRTA